MSDKQKKISFKYYLNKRIKEDRTGAYPVYLRITFNRESTHMKPFGKVDIRFTDSDFQKFEKGDYSGEVSRYANILNKQTIIIEEIIRREYEKSLNFSIKGISTLIHIYQEKIKDVLKAGLIIELGVHLESLLSYSEYLHVMGADKPEDVFYRASEIMKASLDQELTERLRVYYTAYVNYSEFVSQSVAYKSYDGVDSYQGQIIFNFSIYDWQYYNGKTRFLSWGKGQPSPGSELLTNFYTLDKISIEDCIVLIDSEIKKFLAFQNTQV